MHTSQSTQKRRITGLICGSVIGGAVFGLAGSTHVSQWVLGGICGILIGGIIGYSRVAWGMFGPITLWSLAFALFFFTLGPGFADDYGGNGALSSVPYGAFLGYLWKHRRDHLTKASPHAKTTDSHPLR